MTTLTSVAAVAAAAATSAEATAVAGVVADGSPIVGVHFGCERHAFWTVFWIVFARLRGPDGRACRFRS